MTYHNPSDCKYILMLSQERKPLKKIIDFRYFKTVFVSKTIGRGMFKKNKMESTIFMSIPERKGRPLKIEEDQEQLLQIWLFQTGLYYKPLT